MAIIEIQHNGQTLEIDVPEGQDVEAAVAEVTGTAAPQSNPSANTSPFPADKGKLTVAEQRKQGPINPLTELKKFSGEMQNTGTEVAAKLDETTRGTIMEPVGRYGGAAVGTTIAMAPDIIGSMPGAPIAAVKGGQILPAAGNKLRNLATALTPGGKQAIGAEIGALQKAAGVQDTIPTIANTAKKMHLPPQERSFADIVTATKRKIADKEPLDAQDLVDFKELVKKRYAEGKLVKGTKEEAITAKTNSEAEALLNKLVQGREKLSKRYGDVSQIQKVLKKIAVGTAGAGATGAVMTAIAKLVKG